MQLIMRGQPKSAKHSSHVMKSGFCPNHVLWESYCAAWAGFRELKESLSTKGCSFVDLLHLRGTRDREPTCLVSALAMPELAIMHAVRSPVGLLLSRRLKRHRNSEQPTRSHCHHPPRRRDPLPRRSIAQQKSDAGTASLKGKTLRMLPGI